MTELDVDIRVIELSMCSNRYFIILYNFSYVVQPDRTDWSFMEMYLDMRDDLHQKVAFNPHSFVKVEPVHVFKISNIMLMFSIQLLVNILERDSKS